MGTCTGRTALVAGAAGSGIGRSTAPVLAYAVFVINHVLILANP